MTEWVLILFLQTYYISLPGYATEADCSAAFTISIKKSVVEYKRGRIDYMCIETPKENKQ